MSSPQEELGREVEGLRAKNEALEQELLELKEELRRSERQHEVLENFVFGVEQEYAKAQQKLTQAEKELSASLEEVRRQQAAVRALGTPLIDVWDRVIALPIIGAVDEDRAVAMTESLLTRVAESSTSCVIVDLTGVDFVDTSTADHLLRLVKAVRLQGAFCVVTGIGPAIAQTIIALSIDFDQVRTLRSLREGLRACIAHMRRGDVWREGSARALK
jgi:rsbT co-antagonist protein RsbR